MPWVVVMFDPPEITIAESTTTVIFIVPIAFTASVTVTVSFQVPTGVVVSTVTIPVLESIEIPVTVGLIENLNGVDPPVKVNAGVTWRMRYVVVTFPPPLTIITGFTTNLITLKSWKPSRSVTVTVS